MSNDRRSSSKLLAFGSVAACIGQFVVMQASAETIYACINTNSGVMLIAEEDASCGPQGKLVQWETGPAVGTHYQYEVGGMYPDTSVAIAFCPPGTKVVGGGGLTYDSSVGLQQSFPIAEAPGGIAWGDNAIGWQVAATDWSQVQAHVVCAGPPPEQPPEEE